MGQEKKVSLKDKAYEHIKSKIILCEMMPGSDISEEELANELGISRTPVREAIMMLENENLVHVFPRKGSFVSQITLKDIQEIFQIREVVETQVGKMVCKTISEEMLMAFRARFEAIDSDGNYISY